jgi:hypothetical protein
MDTHHVSWAYISQLYFVLTTDEPMAPTVLCELLGRIAILIADYCGRCSEISIVENIGMAYEIVDEVLSFGCPQVTDASLLRHLIHNVAKEKGEIMDLLREIDVFQVVFDSDMNRPLAAADPSKSPSELFFMLSEKLEVSVAMSNQIQRCLIVGEGMCKSFLAAQPSVLVQLDPQMTFGGRGQSQQGGRMDRRYDDITFAPAALLHSFDSDRSITFAPPEGLTRIFAYRTSRSCDLPFTIALMVETRQAKVVVIRVSFQSKYPVDKTAKDVQVVFQAPVEISSASCELPSSVADKQSSEWDAANRQVKWRLKEFPGLHEFSARFRFIFDGGLPAAAESLLGPIALQFHLPGWLASGAEIKTLAVSSMSQGSQPKRWLRTETTASCFTFNFN